jgi:hypothetical protein
MNTAIYINTMKWDIICNITQKIIVNKKTKLRYLMSQSMNDRLNII